MSSQLTPNPCLLYVQADIGTVEPAIDFERLGYAEQLADGTWRFDYLQIPEDFFGDRSSPEKIEEWKQKEWTYSESLEEILNAGWVAVPNRSELPMKACAECHKDMRCCDDYLCNDCRAGIV